MYRSLLISLFICSSFLGVMVKYILISFLVFVSLNAFTQSNGLIYTKIISGNSTRVIPCSDASGYLVPYFFSAYEPVETDVGIFEETSINYVFTDTVYKNAIAVYDNNFTLSDIMYIKSTTGGGDLNLLSHYQLITSGQNAILYFNGLQLSLPNSNKIFTPSASFSSDIPLQSLFVKINATSGSASELLRFSYDNGMSFSDFEPFYGYFQGSFFGENKVMGYNKLGALVNDSMLISYLPLYDQQSIHTPLETMAFSNWNGQVNLIRIAININSGELLSAEQLGSSQGNLNTFVVEPTRDMSGIFRTGLVRGNNTPVSVSGNELEMSSNDSLYHVFITKEDAAGQTLWLTELYAYNNLMADTILPDYTPKFETRHQFQAIIEKDYEVFTSTSQKAMGINSDSILYRNFLGQSFLYASYIPMINPDNYYDQILFSQKAIFKLDAFGNVLGKLSHKDKISNHDSGMTSLKRSGSDFFEISDKFAWVNTYEALNDSVGEFVFTKSDGTIDTTFIDFPAGTASYILWLDANLNIVDYWIFPYHNAYVGDMRINSVNHFGGDTLLIQGFIAAQTVTDLDPFGSDPLFTADKTGSFYAFYAAPEIISTTSDADQKSPPFKIYPNPTQDVLNILGIADKNATYTIYDIAGRTVEKGKLASSQINTQSLKPGMYILSIASEKGSGTQKFVVR